MINDFFNAICRVGIFMICAQAIIHFKPNKAYEKYIKLLVSAMILIQVILPIAEFFSTEGQESLEERGKWFEQQIQESMEAAGKAALDTDALLSNMTLEEVKTRLADAESSASQEEAAADNEAAVSDSLQEELIEENNVSPVEKVKVEIGQ